MNQEIVNELNEIRNISFNLIKRVNILEDLIEKDKPKSGKYLIVNFY